jgi:hypothetical protein
MTTTTMTLSVPVGHDRRIGASNSFDGLPEADLTDPC